MDIPPDEARYRWQHRQPVAGLAFLAGDFVAVAHGPHSGAVGEITGLVSLGPPPVLAITTPRRQVIQAAQPDLIPGPGPTHSLGRLMRWYSLQCDGDWEHSAGLDLQTLDNPGWRLRIPLEGTGLADRPFPPIEMHGDDRDWVVCRVEAGVFVGACGPLSLEGLLVAFLDWAEQQT